MSENESNSRENKIITYLFLVGVFFYFIMMLTIILLPKDSSVEKDDADINYESILNDEISYQSQKNKSVKIRLKYFTDYESVDKSINDGINDSIYKLYVNEILVSESYKNNSFNLPEVSEVYDLTKKQNLSLPFEVKVNKDIDRDLTRIDMKVIVEELVNGKWVPVYQVVFMERGPYWSLDKGPIEKIK